MTRILLIDGHPDPDPGRFIHAAADAYAEGAENAGHEVKLIRIAELDFPLVRSFAQWNDTPPPPSIADAQSDLSWAEHVVIFYPMWLGDIPALLKGFLEQVCRPSFAFRNREGGIPEKLLKGRSAHVVVSMGMPAIFYTLVYRAHSLKSLKRNILKFAGFAPVRHSIIGGIEGSASNREKWLARLGELGRRAR
jgi:putative NADPH-quinone reductase